MPYLLNVEIDLLYKPLHYCPMKNRTLFYLSFCLDTTASSAQVQKNEKINSRLKTFGENFLSTDTRKE